MASVKKFLSALKTDAQFTKGLGQLELKSAQRRNIGPTEVIDFIIRSSPQAKQPAADKVKKKRAPKNRYGQGIKRKKKRMILAGIVCFTVLYADLNYILKGQTKNLRRLLLS